MSIQTEICPLCGEGSLHEVGRDRTVEHKGTVGYVHTKASECDVCGCSQASPSQVRDNQRAMAAFQKMAQGRLTGQQMRDARNKLRLTQSQAALIFGGGPNSFAKYEADDVTQSEAMDNLVRLALEVPTAKNWLYSKASIKDVQASPEHIWAQQVYNFNLANLPSIEPNLHKGHLLTFTDRYAQIQKPRPSIEKRLLRNHQFIDVGASLVVGYEITNEVDSKVRVYGEEENIQSFLSPKYSEEDYDRHTQR